MNKRIIEFAELSGFDCAPDGFIYHPDTGDQNMLDIYLEKFAELIVDECLTLCNCEDAQDIMEHFRDDKNT